jgi:chromosome segregation ATPase
MARERLPEVPKGDRTPARRELAAVIAQRDQAAKELADTRAAIARAKQIVTEAERGLAQVISALDETKHEVGKRVAQALTAGNKPEQDNSLRDACIRQLDAESQLAAAQSALAQLETSIEEHQYVIEQANKQVNEAALAVIAAEVDRLRLIEDLHAAHARWGTLHAQLHWMVQNDLTGDFDPDSAYPNHLDRMRRGGPSVEGTARDLAT